MNCDRCGERTNVHIMSMFNTEDICMTCKRAERLHPRYEEARAAEDEAARRGNVNFPGIGLPTELVGGGHHLVRRVEVEPGRVVQPPRDPDRPGANGVCHIAGDEKTLCGLGCEEWHYPFCYSGLGAVDVTDKSFCTPCLTAYAEEEE
jgi:hypothetical protein